MTVFNGLQLSGLGWDLTTYLLVCRICIMLALHSLVTHKDWLLVIL